MVCINNEDIRDILTGYIPDVGIYLISYVSAYSKTRLTQYCIEGIVYLGTIPIGKPLGEYTILIHLNKENFYEISFSDGSKITQNFDEKYIDIVLTNLKKDIIKHYKNVLI